MSNAIIEGRQGEQFVEEKTQQTEAPQKGRCGTEETK
jgi:hypothetical protein